MADAQAFFNTGNNTQMCILYEYLRGLTPYQAMSELKRAGNVVDISKIIKWFARFKAREYSLDVSDNGEPLRVIESEEYRNALTEYDNANKSFNPENLDADLSKFVNELDEILAKPGVEINELEINVRNTAQPSHVLIGIEHSLRGVDPNAPMQHHVVEIYHCSTGVVVRRGQASKLIEADDCSYYPVAIETCRQVVKKLEKVDVRIRSLSLRIDKEDTRVFPNRSTNSVHFFQKLKECCGGELLEDESSASLMQFAKEESVQGLEELNLKYDSVLRDFHQARLMKEKFDSIFEGKKPMKCTITIKVSDELVKEISANVQLFKDDKSHLSATSDEIVIIKQKKPEIENEGNDAPKQEEPVKEEPVKEEPVAQ